MFASKDIFLKSSGGYQISRSVRLRSSASAYLSRTLTTPTDRKKWTWSGWVKRSNFPATYVHIFGTGTASSDTATAQIQFYQDNLYFSGFATGWLKTNAVYRDPSAWYHIVVTWDNANATASNRCKIFVNGIETTYSVDNRASLSTTTDYGMNYATLHTIGAWSWNNGTFAQPEYFDGYMTEVNFIDGQALTPSSFGETNSVTGVWQPKKYGGTYGTNGFYLNFSDNSAATAAAIGKDYSGNGNNWTPNNISVTAGVTYDSMLDVPTLYADGGNGRGNYATLNPLDKNSNLTLSDGNLTAIPASTADYWLGRATMAFPTTGKWYWELTLNNTPYLYQAGIYSYNRPLNGSTSSTGNEYQVLWGTSVTYIQYQSNNAAFAAWATNTNPTSGDVLMFAYDAGNATMWVGRNGTWYNTSGTANPATNTDPRFSSIPTGLFAGVNLPNPASGGVSMNFGQRPFSYTPPTGYVALNTQNLPTPTISNGATVMAASTYTGTGATQTIANSGNNAGAISFKPDWVWIKSRSAATNNNLFDSVRGTTNYLISNSTAAEATNANTLTAFGTTGFTLGSDASSIGVNVNAATYVAWQWQAGAGSTSSNTSGSITSTVSVNATAGFSGVTYTGTGANATIGHGLGVAPKMVIVKLRSGAGENWNVWHTSLASTTYRMLLNTTGAVDTTSPTIWSRGGINPTSTTFTVGTATGTNGSSSTFVAYCFAAVAGYSAFGSYTGNASTDGPFVYLGFRPRWLMVKRFDSTGNWYIVDSARDLANVTGNYLSPNLSNAEATTTVVDFLSNGFKIRSANVELNGTSMLYAAFAENPFKISLAR